MISKSFINFILIGSGVISLCLVLCAISWIRIYYRTGMKSAMLIGISTIIGTVGFLGTVYGTIKYKTVPWENLFSLIFFSIMITGAFIGFVADALYYTKESGLWKKICDQTTIRERILGKVPILKHEKVPSPFFKRRTILIIGISMMMTGLLIIIFKISHPYFLIASISAFISGLLLAIFSVVYLKD